MSKKLSGGQLAGGNSVDEKADNDFYTSNPKTVELFLNQIHKDGIYLQGKIWENACGTGNISKVIKEYYPNNCIYNSDLCYYGYGMGGVDFLKSENHEYDTIITNPPFSLLNGFITKGLELTNKYLIYFCKLQGVTSDKRVDIYEENKNLKYVYVHRNRQATWKNNEPINPKTGKKWATTQEMAWFIWDKEYNGEPIIRWI